MLPFSINLANRAVNLIEPPDELDYDRPFWHMTTAALEEAEQRDELDMVAVPFDRLRALVGDTVPTPRAMIFHIGRCGSTLVSRMVGHDRRHLVLREAKPIGGLHRGTAGSDLVPTFTVEQAFKDVLVAFEHFAEARGFEDILVKHSSWESFSMPRIAEVLPDTPLIFVCRNPIEIVESSLHGPPGWGSRLHEPPALLHRWVPWLQRVDPPYTAATVFAGVWASGVNAALELPSDRVFIVDHAELTAAPGETLERLSRHARLDFSIDDALGELNRYSKAQDDSTEYDPDERHAHPSLTEATRRHVLDVVGELPDRLAARLAEQD
ncbi:MAG: sulfotransferase [Actinomycetota bacterium]